MVHKKKISEYTHSDYEGEDDLMVNKEDLSDSENGDGQNENNKSYGSAGGNDDGEETTHEDDDVQGRNVDSQGGVDARADEDTDYNEDFEESANKKTKKRKAADKPKKSNNDDETDDEALNGVGAPKKKKGSKPAAKAGGKGATKGKAKAAKKPAPVEEDDGGDDEEEEYEVKDIVGHKTERGVSYFLIRWKGYTKDDDTWEAESTLSCPEIIKKYKEKNMVTPKKGAAKSPVKKGKSSAAAAKSSKKDDDDDEEEEEEYEVDKIIDYAEEKKGRVFRIRWKGFGPKHDTWEPEANLSCDDIIEKFMKKMKSQENVNFKELREEPKKTKRLVNETAPRTNLTNPGGRKSKRGSTKKRVFYGEED